MHVFVFFNALKGSLYRAAFLEIVLNEFHQLISCKRSSRSHADLGSGKNKWAIITKLADDLH